MATVIRSARYAMQDIHDAIHEAVRELGFAMHLLSLGNTECTEQADAMRKITEAVRALTGEHEVYCAQCCAPHSPA